MFLDLFEILVIYRLLRWFCRSLFDLLHMSNFKFSNIILENKYSSYSTIQTAQRLYAGFASTFIERGSWFLLCIVPICPSSEQVL